MTSTAATDAELVRRAPGGALDRWFLRPLPPTRLAALRILVGAYGTVYLAVRVPHVVDLTRLPAARFDPVGPLGFLGSPLPGVAVMVGLVAGIATGAAFTAGWRHRVLGPLHGALLLGLTTYENSFQQVNHTTNLLVLHTLVLAVSPAAAAWSLDARRRGTAPVAHGCFGWPVQLMSVLTVATYVVAGWAKVRHGGTGWITGDVLRHQVAFDNVRKIVLGDHHSPLGGWLVAHGWTFRPMAWATLVVELGAPLALLGGRLRTVWVASAWLFHVGVLALMAILFPYPLVGIAFASLLAPERPMAAVGRRLRVALARSGPAQLSEG